MSRIAGIVIFVVGILLLVLGIAKVLPGAAQGGGFTALTGLVVFLLSFIKRHEPGPDAPPALSPFERITGVFFEPARVFQNLRSHPRWLAAFLVMALFGITYQIAFTQRMTPEAIAIAPIDKLIEGGWIPADKAAQMREQTLEAAKAPAARLSATLTQVNVMFLAVLFFAAVYLVMVLIFGGRLNFWQALSVATYAALPPAIIQNVLSLILLYIKSPDDIDPLKGQGSLVRADLGVLFSGAEHPYLYTLGGFFGVFIIYGLWLTATGLRHTGTKVSSGSAWTIVLLLLALRLLLALGGVALFPTFVA